MIKNVLLNGYFQSKNINIENCQILANFENITFLDKIQYFFEFVDFEPKIDLIMYLFLENLTTNFAFATTTCRVAMLLWLRTNYVFKFNMYVN